MLNSPVLVKMLCMTSTSPIVSCTILLEITSSPAQLSLLSAANITCGKLKCGEVEPQTWKPCTPSVQLVEYATIRQQVLKDLDKTLQGFCCQNPFPLGSNFGDENYWHALRAMPYQRPKLTNAAPAPPALFAEPTTAPSEPRSILDYLSREQPFMNVIQRSPAVEYTLRSLSSNKSPSSRSLSCLASWTCSALVTLTCPI